MYVRCHWFAGKGRGGGGGNMPPADNILLYLLYAADTQYIVVEHFPVLFSHLDGTRCSKTAYAKIQNSDFSRQSSVVWDTSLGHATKTIQIWEQCVHFLLLRCAIANVWGVIFCSCRKIALKETDDKMRMRHYFNMRLILQFIGVYSKSETSDLVIHKYEDVEFDNSNSTCLNRKQRDLRWLLHCWSWGTIMYMHI